MSGNFMSCICLRFSKILLKKYKSIINVYIFMYDICGSKCVSIFILYMLLDLIIL